MFFAGEVDPQNLFLRVGFPSNPFVTPFEDSTITGVSNISNIPFGNIPYKELNSMARQWIRQYCVALSMEQLGYIRSKFGSIPIPNADVTLNGSDLISNGRTNQDNLKEKLRDLLNEMTYDKLIEIQAARAENIQKQLKYVPIPNGFAIKMV